MWLTNEQTQTQREKQTRELVGLQYNSSPRGKIFLTDWAQRLTLSMTKSCRPGSGKYILLKTNSFGIRA